MGAIIDLTGNHYGMLVVLGRDETSNTKQIKWICKCQCGTIKSILGYNLRNGRTKSCGCQMYKDKGSTNHYHGMSRTHIYQEWLTIRKRCKPDSRDAKTYYQRGITVCDEWQNNFLAFYDWSMANGYDDSLSIDRIDNNRGYSPDNCRWIDIRLQQSNKSNTVKVMYEGQEYCLRTLCNMIGFPYSTAHRRYRELKRNNKPITSDVLFAPLKTVSA